ncbi:uncharacterized protein LOC134177486 [Corticium candelabrum]|uniref:uncharacterized protein LOC134177486 n=1 Tax=Corticium candelabrum TaxID=121492 RepID=UPI002E25B528|nr:uncharacterized protein LOC134177486 [Corticium candelabrum]
MYVLLIAFCYLQATADGVDNTLQCGSDVHYLSNESFQVYQVAKGEIRLRPPPSRLRQLAKGERPLWYASPRLTNDTISAFVQRYDTLAVTMSELFDKTKVSYVLKGNSNYKSSKVTLRLGKPVMLLVQNASDIISVDRKSFFRLCFKLSGVPSPNLSLHHSPGDGNEQKQTPIRAKRYRVNGNCLEFGPAWPRDSGNISLNATNCFNSVTHSFRLYVNGT